LRPTLRNRGVYAVFPSRAETPPAMSRFAYMRKLVTLARIPDTRGSARCTGRHTTCNEPRSRMMKCVALTMSFTMSVNQVHCTMQLCLPQAVRRYDRRTPDVYIRQLRRTRLSKTMFGHWVRQRICRVWGGKTLQPNLLIFTRSAHVFGPATR
jgi:hypothetical protein